MSVMQFVRPLAGGILVVAIVTITGCSSSSEKPQDSSSQSAGPKSASAEEAVATTKLPTAEFQQPPVVPPSEPLPKPSLESVNQPHHNPARPQAEDSVGNSALAQAAERSKDSDSARPSNPLRNGSEPAAATSSTTPVTTPVDEPPKKETLPTIRRPSTGKNSGAKFDPILVNGPIFQGWKKPKVALVITGMEEGYLEPCGCAGLDRMKGGMGRRATMFAELRQKGWPVVGLDVGGLIHGFGRQTLLKYQIAVEGKRKMGYQAVAFGADDLRLSVGDLLSVTFDTPFVAANVGLLGKPGEYAPKWRIIEAGGMKIGVTAVLGKQYQKTINNSEIELSDPVAALEKIVPELAKDADYLVLLSHATMEESEELGKRFPAFRVVVSSDGKPEPPDKPQEIPGTKTLLITVGYKGQNAIVLGLFNDADPPSYQRVPLDSRFAASPEMKKLMTAYQENLKIQGFAALTSRPVPHPLSKENGKFIGTKKCAESCHEKSYDIWRKSAHRLAYDTLAKLDPPRNFDPECISCHVTGWHPTKFFPYEGGFESQEKTPHLVNVGCEDCHGPGEKHAAAELAGSDELKAKYRKAVVITKADSKKQQCYTCHDIDNSPEFDFDKYWPFVEHYEKEPE